MTTYWFAMWRCGCNTLDPASGLVPPPRCPLHEAEAIYPNSFGGEHYERIEAAAGLPTGLQTCPVISEIVVAA
jgi:hypothetical protein